MSVRGIASGVAGSAAVAVVAAMSLGMTRAAADTETTAPAHVRVAPAAHVTRDHALLPQPAWLRRLLSRSDLPVEAPQHRG